VALSAASLTAENLGSFRKERRWPRRALLEPVSVPTIPCYSLLFGFFQGQGSLPFAAGSCTLDISPRILGLLVTPEGLGKRHQISVGATC
jgi:hypothetical protein